MLKLVIIPVLAVSIFFISGCSANTVPKTEFEFANKLAQNDLWKEAYYRWSRLLEQGNESAALYNNIAVAYEKMGQFDEAEKAYKKGLKLSPNNATIKNNFEKYKKMLKQNDRKDKDENERNKKKTTHIK